jgi:hypothetical protein
MYYFYVEIEYVATSFSPTRTDLALKLLICLNKKALRVLTVSTSWLAVVQWQPDVTSYLAEVSLMMRCQLGNFMVASTSNNSRLWVVFSFCTVGISTHHTKELVMTEFFNARWNRSPRLCCSPILPP